MQVGALGKTFLRESVPLPQLAHALAQGRPEIVHWPKSWPECARLKIDHRLIFVADMGESRDLLGAGMALLFIALRWAAQNWRFIFAIGLGLWAFLVLHDLAGGVSYLSAQLSGLSRQIDALHETVTKATDRAEELEQAVDEIRNAAERMESRVERKGR